MQKQRIESIDFLRGIIMVIMALDHTRDYFHIGAFKLDPTDLTQTTPILFFTRFITHYCAPVFVLLAGTSAFLYGQNKTKKELSSFLLTRGIWLIICELTIVKFLWSFDYSYHFVMLQVIWAIGCSMVFISFLIYLPKKFILFLGLLIVFGHNLLDTIHFTDKDISSILWYIVHQQNFIEFSSNIRIGFFYPFLPWLGIMICGFCLGQIYQETFNSKKRKKYLRIIGISSLLLFVLLRTYNLYGNPSNWSLQKNVTFSFLSFINVEKYPPSVDYTLITIGPSLLFLSMIESFKNRFANFFLVFGRVPFFYYLMHIFFIHGISSLTWYVISGTTDKKDSTFEGFHLGMVYLIWVCIVMMLYFPCFKYMRYKAKHKEKKWLSYL